MHDDDRPRAWRDRFREGERSHEQRVVADVGEAGSGAGPHHGGGGGDERVCRNDNVIARAYAKRGQAEVQGIRTVGEADGMARTTVRTPLSLEGRDGGTSDVRAV